MIDTREITRFEVIDHRIPYDRNSEKGNRILVEYGISIKLSAQDNGKTLKIFINNREEKNGKQNQRTKKVSKIN